MAELSPLLEGTILRKVQELPNEWLKLKLQTKQGTKDLIITPNAFFVTSFSMPAKQQSSGFGAFLRKRLSNKRIISLKQHSFDRIVLLEFDEYFLVLELFAKGNIILVTKELEIVSAYRKEQWKDRTISKNQPYKFPSSKGKSPDEVSLSWLKEVFAESKDDCIRALLSNLNIAPVAGEEACLNAKVEKTTPAAKLKQAELKKLISAVKELYQIDPKRIKPGISSKQLLPFKMAALGEFEESFSSLNQAVDENLAKALSVEKVSVEKKTSTKSRLEKSLDYQTESIQGFKDRAELARQKAEAIYSNYPAINSALETVQSFVQGKTTKQDVMYKLKSLGLELKQIDLKNKRLIVEIHGLDLAK